MPFSAAPPFQLVFLFSSLPSTGEPVSICFCKESHYLPSLPDPLHKAIVILLLLPYTWDAVLCAGAAPSGFHGRWQHNYHNFCKHSTIFNQPRLDPVTLEILCRHDVNWKHGHTAVIAPTITFPSSISRQLHFRRETLEMEDNCFQTIYCYAAAYVSLLQPLFLLY